MILVVGATGLVGGMIARGLLQRGERIRVLVRKRPDYQPIIDAGAEPVVGDLKDPASLATACRGVDVVVTTASAGSRGGEDTPETVDLEGNRNLIDAARSARVGQFILISTTGANDASPVPLLRAKAIAEAHLRASGLTYTILAANMLMDLTLSLVIGGPARAGLPVTLIGEARRRHSFIAARDVAAFAVEAARHPAKESRRVIIGGPDALSLRDVVATYGRVLGRTIPTDFKAPGELLPNLPPVPGLAEVVSSMVASLEMFDSPIDMTETAQTFGVRMTSLEDFVRSERIALPA